MCTINKELLDYLWEMAFPVDGFNQERYRHDACGAWIERDKYGDRTSPYGWEIDHIYPQSMLKERNVAQEDIDDRRNLRPLNWQNNDSKGVDYPVYHAKVRAEGNKNVEDDRELVVHKDTQQVVDGLYGKYLK